MDWNNLCKACWEVLLSQDVGSRHRRAHYYLSHIWLQARLGSLETSEREDGVQGAECGTGANWISQGWLFGLVMR